jgi:hypothetical protein
VGLSSTAFGVIAPFGLWLPWSEHKKGPAPVTETGLCGARYSAGGGHPRIWLLAGCYLP